MSSANKIAHSDRLIAIIQMIESTNNLINCLQNDLDAYNADNIKVRAMLSKSWIEKNLVKYTGIRERLTAWYSDRISVKPAITAPEVNIMELFTSAA